MKKNNEIIVGVSTYNGEKTLEKTLKSLEKQKFKNFSVFISDDKSTDNTVEIIKSYSKRNDNFYYEINNENTGMISNLNKIFLRSKSKYFTWVDQDDYREENFLQECYDEIKKNPNASLVYAQTGIRNKKNGKLMHINTINSIANIKDISKRYINLLNNFHDTIIYSLIRTESLRNTSLWTNINGSANRLIFELALEGEFVQVKKTLSYYNGKGLSNRYSQDQEFFRQSKVKRKFYQIAFLILFLSQLRDIFVRNIDLFSKFKIFLFIILNFLLINLSKLVFRVISKIFFKKLDNLIFNIILKIIPENKDIIYLVDKKLHLDFYPKYYPYKKVKGKD